MSNCFHAMSPALARSKFALPRPILTVASSRSRQDVSPFTMPIGPYESGSSWESRRKRSIASRDGRRTKNISTSGRDGTAEQRFAYQSVDGDHESSNGRHTKRQSRRRQKLLCQRDERR